MPSLRKQKDLQMDNGICLRSSLSDQSAISLIYPNPTSSGITFSQEVNHASIYSVEGGEVAESRVKSGMLDLSRRNRRSYFIPSQRASGGI